MPNDIQQNDSVLELEQTDLPDDDRAAALRQRATDMLGSITARTKDALAERGVAYDLFFLVPNSGDAIMIFGTTVEPDPSDAEWKMVGEVVGEIVSETVGMDGTRTREVACAMVRQTI